MLDESHYFKDNYSSFFPLCLINLMLALLIPTCSVRRKNTELNPADLILAKLPLKSVRVL